MPDSADCAAVTGLRYLAKVIVTFWKVSGWQFMLDLAKVE
jgi:hypothetical protein